MLESIKEEEKMQSNQKICWSFLSIYGILYVLLYIGYNFIFHLLNTSYSWISFSAILLPFVFILLLQIALWSNHEIHLRKNKKVRTKHKVLLALSSIPPLYCMVLLGINEYKSKFTIEKWLENPTERVCMVDDLLNKYDLKDKTKDEVAKLMGPPDETAYFKGENCFVYLLGIERGLIRIDNEWLIIEFDENDKVTTFDIFTD